MVREEPKGWGREIIFADTPAYCGKLLCFDKALSKFSMHFHDSKIETWYVQKGSFTVSWIDTKTSKQSHQNLRAGDVWHNPRLLPHQLTALEDGSVIIEVSTADSKDDNYRVMPGDSQI